MGMPLDSGLAHRYNYCYIVSILRRDRSYNSHRYREGFHWL